MFDYQTKVDSAGKEAKKLKLHAATKRNVEFCIDFAEKLGRVVPSMGGPCEQACDALRQVLIEAAHLSGDKPAEPAVDEATEAKLDEIAPRPSKAG